MKMAKRAVVAAMLATTAMAAPVRAETVRMVGWSISESATKPFVEQQTKAIEARQAGLKLEQIGFPYAQTLQNMILRFRSNQPEEVLQMSERWVPALAAMNVLRDVDPLFGKADLEAAIDPAFLKMGEVNGVRRGVPWIIGSIGVVQNSAVLAKAGLKEAPKTMIEWRDHLRKIKAAIPNSVPLAMSTVNPDLIQVEAQIVFWQFGARFFKDGKVAINSPQAREALKFLVSLVEEGLIAKGNDRNAARRLFAQELVGYYFDPPVARGFARQLTGKGPAYDTNVQVIPTPAAAAGEPPRSVVWAHLLGVTTPAMSPAALNDAKMVVAHFALNPETQMAYWRDQSVFPSTRKAIDQLKSEPYAASWLALARTALPDEPSQFANSERLRRIIGEEIEAALLGAKAPDAAIAEMAKRLEAEGLKN